MLSSRKYELWFHHLEGFINLYQLIELLDCKISIDSDGKYENNRFWIIEKILLSIFLKALFIKVWTEFSFNFLCDNFFYEVSNVAAKDCFYTIHSILIEFFWKSARQIVRLEGFCNFILFCCLQNWENLWSSYLKLSGTYILSIFCRKCY